MLSEIEAARRLSLETGCPTSECIRAIRLCGNESSAYFFLKLTGEAVVRYKESQSGPQKWTAQDYVEAAIKLAKSNACP